MTRHSEDETLDERLSAALDGELDAAEREALEAQVAAEPALAARRAAFASVDDGLRALAAARAAATDPATIDRGWEAVRARVAAGDVEGLGPSASEQTAGRPARSRGFGPALFWAAAAAAAIWLLAPGKGAPPDAPPAAEGPDRLAIENGAPGDPAAAARVRDLGLDDTVDPAPLMALGYGEEADDGFFVPGVPIEDLPVIEELDLLDYLKARERAELGGRG